MKILVIDNYDSFTYNLVHYIQSITDEQVDVFRNDEIDLEAVSAYDKILLSPGPGIPSEAGICLDVIKKYGATKDILGVCLGHQAIGEAYGGTLENLDTVYHGVATPVHVLDEHEKLFESIPSPVEVGRYHSWVVSKENLPSCFTITCEEEDGLIMGISHKDHKVKGVQFHPESVLTDKGMQIMENWVKQ